ncbi:unnamed protein product [Ostreobium quekettii]|uniref:Transmembrane protein n=1 Tax=Ostreobium quekettii TaxID=121088 RepID=A0A8S1J1A5_9CHLO|nr:unnamed protein product [Ostreobium quekettii]
MGKKSKKEPKKPKVILTQRQKVHKWFRLVGLLTVRKHGASILAQLYYAFLVSAVVRAMDKIWTEYSESQDCQYQFVANVTSTMSKAYDEASRALATAALDNTRCIMNTIDVNLPSPLPDLPLSSLPDGVMVQLFGWISAPDIGLPDVELTINTTADAVLEDIEDDVSKMSKVALWADYMGFVLAAISVLIILGTATYYTVKNKTWKPSKKRWFMILLNIGRALLFYIIAVLVVYMQAYAMDHACAIRIQDTQLSLPKCEVREECGFSCANEKRLYENKCPECDIPLKYWWADWHSLPNVLGVMYTLFLGVVYALEAAETRYQRTLEERAERLKSINEEVEQKSKARQRAEDMTSSLLPT